MVRYVWATGFMILLAGCGGSADPIGQTADLSVAFLVGDNQTATVTEQLPDSIQIEVRNGAGALVPNLTVGFFVLTDGGGEPFLPTVLTDAVGQATNFWTLGTIAGEHMMEVRAIIDNLPTILDTIRATALPSSANSISVVSGNDQTQGRGELLPESLVVSVLDQFANNIPSVTVGWVVTNGGGIVSPPSSISSQDARTAWILGSDPGTNTVEARVAGITAATFTATGTASWEQLSSTGPSARGLHAMAYDVMRNRIIVFGGNDGNVIGLNDTWEFDGISWAQISTVTSPPAREFQGQPGMVYDLARSRVILFGGSAGFPLFADTWEYDGVNWQEVITSNSPDARRGHSIVYDTDRSRVVLFGGVVRTGGDAVLSNDTWEYDGSDWLEVATATRPSTRAFHSMAYDPTRNRTVLFGGSTTNGDSDETWEYDGVDWTLISTDIQPPARDAHAMAYLGGVVLFGGSDSQNNSVGDTWTFDGTTWTEVPIETDPSARTLHSLVANSNQILLFGGRTTTLMGDTWAYPQ